MAGAAQAATLYQNSAYNQNLTEGTYNFLKYHPTFFHDYEFSDDWGFSLAQQSLVTMSIDDFEVGIKWFKILDIDDLELIFDATSIGDGESFTVLLDSATSYMFTVEGEVDGALGGKYYGSLSVAEVPIPAAAWLFGSAILGLSLRARRSKSLSRA